MRPEAGGAAERLWALWEGDYGISGKDGWLTVHGGRGRSAGGLGGGWADGLGGMGGWLRCYGPAPSVLAGLRVPNKVVRRGGR